jgi:hypothetical protein
LSDADSTGYLNIKLNLFTRLKLGFSHLQAYLNIGEVGNHLEIKGKNAYYHLVAFFNARTYKQR